MDRPGVDLAPVAPRLWTAQNLNLLYQITRGAFLAQERHSALGVLWHLLNPLLTTLVLYAVFSNVLSASHIPHYPLFILVGLIQFNFFVHGTTRAAEGLLASRSFVLNTTVPREMLILRAVGVEALTYLIEVGIVIVFIAVLGDGLSWRAVWYTTIVLAQCLLTAGVAFGLGGAVVFLPDLSYVWGVATRLLFFLTPILYSVEMLHQPWLRPFVVLSPLGALVEVGRQVLLGGSPSITEVVIAAAGPAVALIVGWSIFQGLKDHIAEYI